MAYKQLVIVIICIALINPTLDGTALVNQKDDDECGMTLCRDADDSREEDYKLDDPNDCIYKKIWVYYDDYWFADKVRLYIYGRLSGSRDVSYARSHVIAFDSGYQYQFRASDYFNTYNYQWVVFEINKMHITPNSCIEIALWKACTVPKGTEELYVGVDKDFEILNTDPTEYQDYDRSWSLDETGSTPWKDFHGEFMIYLEFADVNEDLSSGHTLDEYEWAVQLEETRSSPYQDADSCGIWLDWSGFTQSEFDSIYRVRIYFYGIAKGTNRPQYDNIQLKVNGNTISFNPFKHFSSNVLCWAGFDIYDPDDKNDWLVRDVNYFSLRDTDTEQDQNNLWITTQDTDSDDSWYYFYDETVNDGEYFGCYNDPESDYCEYDIQYYIEVYKSRDRNELDGSAMYEYSIINMDEYYWDDEPLPSWGVAYMKNDLNTFGYAELFECSSDLEIASQWSIYGERRSKYDIGGDLADIVIYYGKGQQELLRLYLNELDAPEDQSDVPPKPNRLYDEEHQNDDRLDFGSTNIDECTEAEGNDDGPWDRYAYENVGSDGFDYDCEWLFLLADSVLEGHDSSTTKDNDFQTLLFHGLHAIFGFHDEVDEISLQLALALLIGYCIGDYGDPKTIIEAYDHVLTLKGITTGCVYYHEANYEDYLWGVRSDGVSSDVLSKEDIAVEYLGE